MSFYKILSVFVILLTSRVALAQSCNCESNFEWVKKTFEQNDAGFQYVLDQKGQAAYDAHNAAFALKAKEAKTSTACTEILYNWMRFFRKGHFGIERLKGEATTATGPDSALIARHERLKLTGKKFEQQLAAAKEGSLEGIWESAPYTVGIIKTGDHYSGYIIDAAGTPWKKNQLKLKIYLQDGSYKSDFWMRDFSAMTGQTVKMIGKNYLSLGTIFNFKRIKPIYTEGEDVKDYIEFLAAKEPYFKLLAGGTAYLRIPYFDYSEKKKIDSVIAANRSIILSTKNLIIDVRNNGGGSDASFAGIMPFLYTNPVRTVGVEMLASEVNTKAMLGYATDTSFAKETRDWMMGRYEKMSKMPGKFVQVADSSVTISTRDTVYPYPANVVIIINENNASTTEQFLLAARQSRKVKTFGTTTFGALDISNMNGVTSPCGDFKLWYCMSKSFRIPDMTIDGKGLQPDYYIDKTIPDQDWINYVLSVYENR
jgi:hypothetical protein